MEVRGAYCCIVSGETGVSFSEEYVLWTPLLRQNKMRTPEHGVVLVIDQDDS